MIAAAVLIVCIEYDKKTGGEEVESERMSGRWSAEGREGQRRREGRRRRDGEGGREGGWEGGRALVFELHSRGSYFYFSLSAAESKIEVVTNLPVWSAVHLLVLVFWVVRYPLFVLSLVNGPLWLACR